MTFEAVVNAKSLEETEKLYDTFIADVTASPLEGNSAEFESTYPAMKKPPMGMSDRDPMYLSYAAEFGRLMPCEIAVARNENARYSCAE